MTRPTKKHGLMAAINDIQSRLDFKIRTFADRRFDRKYKVETAGIVWRHDLDMDADRKMAAFQYEPTPAPVLRSILKQLRIDYSKYAFIDYGSGKGRALLLASEYPYAKIIGVEFSPGLHKIAENNIRIWNNPGQRCFKIESICADASEYKLPNQPLVIFFFTPFRSPVSNRVINNIKQSFNDSPRSMYIFYYGTNKKFIKLLEQLEFNRKEIYSRRPLSALRKYKGMIFWPDVIDKECQTS